MILKVAYWQVNHNLHFLEIHNHFDADRHSLLFLVHYSFLGPYVLSGGPLIFNVILFKRKAVYTEGAGPVYKCTGQCTLEGCILLF